MECCRQPHIARLPAVLAGPGMCQASAALCHPRMASPIEVAIHSGRRMAWATSAVPAHNKAVVMPNSAPLAAQATGVPGSRRPAS
jgi:hypothetical protein